MKILVSCANGAGTSLMMKMSVEKAVKRLGLPVQYIHHCSLAEGKSSAANYDVVLCPLNFIEMFKDADSRGVSVIGLRNVMSDKEVEEKLISQGIVKKYMK
jgi:PTS system ascorbate-specific IIB component